MKMSMTIKGDSEIINNLKRNNEKLLQAAFEACGVSLKILEESMKNDCPVNKDPEDTDTIHLKESIHITAPKKFKRTVVGKCGPSKKTVIHVEFGTSKMAMRPFMRFQLVRCKDEIRKAVRDVEKRSLGL